MREGRLRVSANGRFLAEEDGRPFFYLGDTAWCIFSRLQFDEADEYLRQRAARGFTAVQVVALFGRGSSDARGNPALVGDDPARPGEEYFDLVDRVVARANSLGLCVGLLPAWGSAAVRDDPLFNASNVRAYGEFLGRRLRDRRMVWILGGDEPAGGYEAVWREMAAGLAAGDGGGHLMTYHPRGQQASSTWLHDESWLSFNMIQSGHRRAMPNHAMIAADYARRPVKPCMDGEPCYENITEDLAAPEKAPWRIDARDARRAAYWSLFAGAHGHTYGCNEVYQFWTPGRQKPPWGAEIHWREAIELPGASQMRHVRALVESRPFLVRVPDQSMIVGEVPGGIDHVSATRASDGSYAFVFAPSGAPVAVNMTKLSGATVRAWWFDPRLGVSEQVAEFPARGERGFEPPSGDDWILALDDASLDFPPPGGSPLRTSGS